MLDRDDLAVITEYVAASDAMHEMYGSTATCWGGIGGSAMTPHCSHICDNIKHRDAQERYHAAYAAVRAIIDEGDRITGRSILRGLPPEQPNIGDTCCGKCAGATCYVDQITGER